MMGYREELKSGDEWDALTRGKRFHRWRAGARRWIKRKFNKRQRRSEVAQIEQKGVYDTPCR